jgi:hypothetical protein
LCYFCLSPRNNGHPNNLDALTIMVEMVFVFVKAQASTNSYGTFAQGGTGFPPGRSYKHFYCQMYTMRPIYRNTRDMQLAVGRARAQSRLASGLSILNAHYQGLIEAVGADLLHYLAPLMAAIGNAMWLTTLANTLNLAYPDCAAYTHRLIFSNDGSMHHFFRDWVNGTGHFDYNQGVFVAGGMQGSFAAGHRGYNEGSANCGNSRGICLNSIANPLAQEQCRQSLYTVAAFLNDAHSTTSPSSKGLGGLAACCEQTLVDLVRPDDGGCDCCSNRQDAGGGSGLCDTGGVVFVATCPERNVRPSQLIKFTTQEAAIRRMVDAALSPADYARLNPHGNAMADSVQAHESIHWKDWQRKSPAQGGNRRSAMEPPNYQPAAAAAAAAAAAGGDAGGDDDGDDDP